MSARSNPSAPLAAPPAARGLVESVGRTAIAGWVEAGAEAHPRVWLTVNGRRVAGSYALEPVDRASARDARQFFFRVKSLWSYLSPADVVEIVCDDAVLPVSEGQSFAAFGHGEGSAKDLFKRLDEGFVFNKKGGFKLSKLRNEPWKRSALALYGKLRQTFADEFGYVLFPCYGTLLGAVRGGDFIGHDDDFDCAYISKFSSAIPLRREFTDIANRLIRLGYDVYPGKTCMKVALADGGVRLDIFHSYFNRAGLYRIPFGLSGTEPYRREDLTGWTEARLGGVAIPAPGNPEKLLAWIYGPTWRVPDPSFNWKRSANFRYARAFPTTAQRGVIEWNDFHARAPQMGSSDFFRSVSSLAAESGAIVDLGCGAGQDTRAFAGLSAAVTVVGVDRSELAIDRAKVESKGQPVESRVSYLAGDVAADGVTGRAFAAARAGQAGGRPLLVYIRRLLERMEGADESKLLETVAHAMTPGDRLAIEFVEYDEAFTPAKYRRTFRKRLDPAALIEALGAFDLRVVRHEATRADESDRAVAVHRIVATKAGVVVSIQGATSVPDLSPQRQAGNPMPTDAPAPLDKTALEAEARDALLAKDIDRAIAAWKAITALDGGRDVAGAPGTVTVVSAKAIRGYVDPAHHNATVQVRLNGRVIATTTACQRRRDRSLPPTAFAIKIKKLWGFVGGGDALTLTLEDGRRLNFEGAGPELRIHRRKRSRSARLFQRLDAGVVFNKNGRLQQSLNTYSSYIDSVMELFYDASQAIEARFGTKVFIFYGTLLGCVRAGDFIAHDDDIDVLYVSRFKTPDEVKDELKAICRFLLARGHGLNVRPFGTKVRHPDAGYRQSFGMHYGWIDDAGDLNVAYGHHGAPYRPNGAIAFKPARIGTFDVDIPVDSEHILSMLYGPTWRVPDPGFSHHTRSRKNDPRYHLSEAEIATFS